MEYDKKSIETFQKKTLEDYNESLIIEKICKVNLVEKTDSSFIQIGIRPLIDEDIFLADSNVYPILPSAGRMVAIGEEDFLIKNIIENENIERIEFKENIEEFPKYINSNKDIVLLSNRFFIEVFTKLAHRIDYEEKGPRLDKRNKILVVSEKLLGNRIIIIDNEAVLWEKELFNNKITDRKEKLDISIKSAKGGKVYITLRSLNKIKHLNPDLIKILEVKDE